MSEFNKSYRIRTEVGKDTQLHVKLDRAYDIIELMSMKINQENVYKFHTSNYGVIAGRVLANDAFGVPNAKISVFIDRDETGVTDEIIKEVLYPYNTTSSQNSDGVRYNLLPDEKVSKYHTVIGTFPNKQYVLDNDNILEVFENYYKFTTRTNNAGDYMIFGVPTGSQTIHVDIDLSDIGILSQKPRDMVYKGYNIEQFENPNKFKSDTNIDSLTQVISQNTITDVIPFWGEDEESTIGISRCDINIQYKFEPTCIFMGSVVSDTSSNGFSKKCIPTPGMGAMDEITTGSGTIEMIRKTYSGEVEEFQVKGTQLINGDGIWCYQIPMNLDYVMTDEYGNMVPTNNPNKGIPTRTRVRFRMSLNDLETDEQNIHRCKILVPHNPNVYSEKCNEELDYQFGTNTKEDSYRDLYWNGVYSVKSYIPRIQKGTNWKNDKFTGFKRVNYYGDNNPIPYNNIRIVLPFAYTLLCALIKIAIRLSGFLNWVYKLCGVSFVSVDDDDGRKVTGSFTSVSGEICNESLEYLCIIPGVDVRRIAQRNKSRNTSMLGMTVLKHYEEVGGEVELNQFTEDTTLFKDSKSIDFNNADYVSYNSKDIYGEDRLIKSQYNVTYEKVKKGKKDKTYVTINLYGIRVTDSLDYFVQCIEMKLAQEFKVIQFDFYNDWINGLIYIPRWARDITTKKNYIWGTLKYGGKVTACNENYKSGKRNLVQQCSLTYDLSTNNVINDIGCHKRKLICHKDTSVRKKFDIFKSSGIVHTVETMKQQFVYYLKPFEESDEKNVRLFATDIILLGTLNECDKWGIPNSLSELQSSSYQMPPNLALTDSDLMGNEYSSNRDLDRFIQMTVYVNNMTISGIKNLDYANNTTCYVGINPLEEDANYTEISGIDWGYTGPLQGITTNDIEKLDYDEKQRLKFYKPGGHFLGLTCRNSETTVKSCVNLSRICEHGVWMSQRHELNIPNMDFDNLPEEEKYQSSAFLDYATVPSGLISKDEISGTNYRRLFASMNKNRLKTKIDEKTGYPIYDFIYVNPTNFGGDLNSFVFDTKIGQDMNRKIAAKNEHYYEYIDENYLERSPIKVERLIDETQIMRTGEFKDDEYIKFRFGYNDNSISNKSEIKKRFLIYERKRNNKKTGIVESVSFPVYDNSFYFYFGLHDGKTALDELKQTYYAVSEKSNDLLAIDKTINFTDIETIYDGACEDKHTGEIKFSLKANDVVYDNKGLRLRVKDLRYYENTDKKTPYLKNGLSYVKNGNTYEVSGESLTLTSPVDYITVTGLKDGDYSIEVESFDGVFASYEFTIKKISVKANVYGENFVNGIDNVSFKQNFEHTRKKFGGYITFEDNIFTIISDNLGDGNGEPIDEFIFPDKNPTSKYLKRIIIKSEDAYIGNYASIFTIEIDPNHPEIAILYKDGSKITEGTCELLENNEYAIPVPCGNVKYTVYLQTSLNDCKIPENGNGGGHHEWEIGTAFVGISLPLELYYNNIPYKRLKPYFSILDSIGLPYGWWSNLELYRNEEKDMTWFIKDNLFLDTDKPHQVKISAMGGTPPYTYVVTGGSKLLENKDYENVTEPTVNEYKDSNYNFSMYVIDKNEQRIPEDENKFFYFPVIYKPFFNETLMISFDKPDTEKNTYLYGHVYNGKTYDIKEGFNDSTINGYLLNNSIEIKGEDYELSIDVNDFKDSYPLGGGGYGYVGELNKYNARKSVLNTVLNNDEIGINTNNKEFYTELSIGCHHSDEGYSYSDYTKIGRNDIKFNKFVIEYGHSISGTGISVNIAQNKDDYSVYYILYDVKNIDETKDIVYPLNGKNNLIKSSASMLLRKIVDGIQNGNLNNLSRHNLMFHSNSFNLINTNYYQSEGKKNDWRCYFIAIPNHYINKDTESVTRYENGIEKNTNSNNLLIPITISSLLDLSEIGTFIPLRIPAINIEYNINSKGETKVYLNVILDFPSFGIQGLPDQQEIYRRNLANKNIIFHFYQNLSTVTFETDFDFLCDISCGMPKNISGTHRIDITQHEGELFPDYDKETDGSNSNLKLYYDFDAKQKNTMSPFTYRDTSTENNGGLFTCSVKINNDYNV